MKAASRTIKQVFHTDIRFLVPMYQRPYVWTADRQWAPLFDDLRRVADRYLTERSIGEVGGLQPEERTPRHFLGAVVLDQEASRIGNVDRRLVIDGQQRLTTLQLLLGVIGSQAERRGETRSAAQIRRLIENGAEVVDPDRPEERWKVWPTNSDREAFVDVMQRGRGGFPSRLREAWVYFDDAIDSWLAVGDANDKIQALASMVQSHLEVVSVELERDDNAQVIFETLNDRGEALLAADLIKNYVFQHLRPGTNPDRLYDSRWRRFDQPSWRTEVRQGRLRRPRIDVFVQHWLSLRLVSDVLATELFNSFKALHRRSEDSVEALLDELHADGDAFEALDAALRDEPQSVEGTFVHRWRALELTAFTPLVMLLFRTDVDAEDRRRGLVALESWMFRRAICRSTAQDINRFALDLVGWISKAVDPPGESIERLLAEATAETRRWPSDNEVRAVLLGQPTYNRLVQRRLVVIFEAIEDQIRRERHVEQPAPRGGLEIEHVMPQQWLTYWRAQTMTDAEIAARDRHVQLLGNLTLVTGRVNKLLTNHPWSEIEAIERQAAVPKANSPRGKRSVLNQHSVLLLNADLCNHQGDWNEASIDERNVALANRILDIWRRPAVGDDWVDLAHGGLDDELDSDEPDSGVVTGGRRLENIPTGTRVVFRGRHGEVRGDLLVVDGVDYTSPSGAARAVANGTQINGWRSWRTLDGKSLADLHDAT